MATKKKLLTSEQFSAWAHARAEKKVVQKMHHRRLVVRRVFGPQD